MALTSTLLPLAASRGYAGSSADTSDSGGDMSVSGRSCGAGHQSIRTVTLCRHHSHVRTTRLGFTLRGGKEFGTGCFVSAVERGSEAHCQGLVVGDQIVRVNGYPIEDATHKEVLFLIQNQSSVCLKVRSVGMIPAKDSYNDSLTWRIVEPDPGIQSSVPSDNHSDHYRSNSNICEDNPVLLSTDVRLVINVAPRAKLGCGICKGPDWKPGIFVQFTKENSLARSSGLRQGDQIIQCNNVVFTPYMDFSEATSVLRNSGVLDLVVRKGSGLDLFAGESSGYNSSASSVAGDQSPETWPNKRLSIVKEESVIDSERLSLIELPHRNGMDRWPDSERVVPNKCNEKPQTTEGGCTVIHVGPSLSNAQDNGADLHADRSRNNNKLTEICMVSKQLETTTTTVLVEVHQSEEEALTNQSDTGSCQLTNSSSACSLSSSGANSLCSAISQELQRRSERRANDKHDVGQPKVELFKCGLDKEKVEQHQQLMEEFKRAHRKMFSQEATENKSLPMNSKEPGVVGLTANQLFPLSLSSTMTGSKPVFTLQTYEEREQLRIKQQLLEEKRNKGEDIDKTEGRTGDVNKERQFMIERDKQIVQDTSQELSRHVRRQRGTAPPPPPLPRPDQTDSIFKAPIPSSVTAPPQAPPLPPPPSPPDCPTPDYDTQSLASEINVQAHQSAKPGPIVNSRKSASSDFVEMQSIESFKLTNPSVAKPKPPSTYFGLNAKNGQIKSSDSSSASSREMVKPTVTIREYPVNQERKNPERFTFLPQSAEISSTQNDESLPSRLQNELTQTLSRAKLKSEQEAAPSINGTSKNVVTISINAQPKSQQSSTVESRVKQNPFYLFQNEKSKSNDRLYNEISNNTKMVSTTALNSSEQNNVNLKKSSIHFPVDNSNKGSVTFNFGKMDKPETRIVTLVQPNGILKNGPAGNVSQVHIHTSPPSNKSSQKSIKFGGITTIAQSSPQPKM